jgi:hypothetical protein
MRWEKGKEGGEGNGEGWGAGRAATTIARDDANEGRVGGDGAGGGGSTIVTTTAGGHGMYRKRRGVRGKEHGVPCGKGPAVPRVTSRPVYPSQCCSFPEESIFSKSSITP